MSRSSLRELLEHARHHTAHYARLLPPVAEPLPEDVGDLFGRLPLLTRRELQLRHAGLRSLELDPASCWVVRTSGSTGEPVEVIVDASSREMEARLLGEHADRTACEARWRERDWIHVALHPGASSRAMLSPWNPERSVVKWNLTNVWRGPDESLRRALERLRGAVVTGLPSVCELLAGRLAACGAPPPQPALLLLSGEAMSVASRGVVARAFGCPVTMTYTLAEAGVVATECTRGEDYHVEPEAALVEILGQDLAPASPGEEGDVVVTPLALRSMPLLRYRTGDRAAWASDACGCGRSTPRLRLRASRVPARLVSATGATVHVVRFAKLLATLELERYAWRQEDDGTVVLAYRSASPMDAAAQSVVRAAVHTALGPTTPIRIERLPLEATASQPLAAPRPVAPGARRRTEPSGPEPSELTEWLSEVLRAEQGLVAAVLTGSGLDPEAASRFSDLDLVLLVEQAPYDRRWFELATALGSQVPALRVAVDTCEALPERAPLLVCRLHSEQVSVVGRVDEKVLPWPRQEALGGQARIWGQEASAALWQRLVHGLAVAPDPVREAWMASKHVLQALRFRDLLRGQRETAAKAVLARARRDTTLPPLWLADVEELVEIAREQRPPPLPTVDAARRFLLTALWIARRSALGVVEAAEEGDAD